MKKLMIEKEVRSKNGYGARSKLMAIASKQEAGKQAYTWKREEASI